MKFRNFLTAGTAIVLSACGSVSQQPPVAIIPLTTFVDSLKCEYAKVLSAQPGRHLDLHGWSLAGSLQLNVTRGHTMNGGISGEGLVPFQGASLSFGMKSGIDRKYTTLTIIPFEMTSQAKDTAICEAGQGLRVEGGLGFGEWLRATIDGLDRAAEGQPKFAVTGLTYEMVFSLEQKTSGEAKISIVPLAVSADALATRNDVQTIHIELTPPQKVVGKKPDGTVITVPDIKPFSLKVPSTAVPLLSPLAAPRS